MDAAATEGGREAGDQFLARQFGRAGQPDIESLVVQETAVGLEAERRLSVCEGSDWFWWFGDYNPRQTIASFDLLFRLHMTRLYEALGVPVPDELSVRIHGVSAGGDAEGGGAMRRSSGS